MLSKRGKANGKAKAKKMPRAARANRKSKAKPSRPRKTRTAGAFGMQNMSISAPLVGGKVQSRFFGMGFGTAAPHDEFPEAGLRITGKLPSYLGTFTQGNTASEFGLFNTGTSAAALINPTGAYGTNSYVLFDYAGPLAIFAQYFRKFRFRRLDAEVTSEIPPGAVTQAAGAGLVLQVSHEPDPDTANALAATYTIATAEVSGNCTRFPVWTPEILCPVIREKRSSPADQLFFVEPAGEETTGTATSRQTSQGAMVAVGSKLNGTGPLVVSTVLIHFVVDLYGFTNLAAGAIAQQRKLNERKAVQSRDRGDSKRPIDQPDADLTDFVSLTPRSNRLKVVTSVEPDLQRHFSSAPPSAQGARVSSKK